MRLVSFRTPAAFGAEPGRADRLGIVEGEALIPAGSLGRGVPGTMAELLRGWPDSLVVLQAALRAEDAPNAVPLSEVELLAPVPRPGKIVAAGVNYRSHAAEGGREPPDHPIFFAKFSSSVTGDGAEIQWSSRLTQAVDYEAELAVVIGAPCRRVDEVRALSYVAGYTCLNDVSARDLQFPDRQFTRGKSLDTFGPMGPWLVTADEIADPQSLTIRSLVNSELRQDSTTAEMIFSVAHLISFASEAFTLEPGDVIATGTPSGVGWYSEPKRLLQDGDEVVVEIEGIGRLVNHCREEAT